MPNARTVLPPLAIPFPTADEPVSQQYQPPTAAYQTGRSPSRGAVQAAAQAHYQQPMPMSHTSVDRNPPSSRVPQLPYTRAAPVISSMSYETRPLYDETRNIQVALPDQEPTIKKKRKRADARQLEALNRMYARTAFPSTEERLKLATDLDMSARSVQIWLAHTFVYATCTIFLNCRPLLSGSRTKDSHSAKADEIPPAQDLRLQSTRSL